MSQTSIATTSATASTVPAAAPAPAPSSDHSHCHPHSRSHPHPVFSISALLYEIVSFLPVQSRIAIRAVHHTWDTLRTASNRGMTLNSLSPVCHPMNSSYPQHPYWFNSLVSQSYILTSAPHRFMPRS